MFTGPIVLESLWVSLVKDVEGGILEKAMGTKVWKREECMVYRQVCVAAWVPEGSGDEAGEMQGWILASHFQAFVSFDSTFESRGRASLPLCF